MFDSTKVKIALNIVADTVTIVFIICLWKYNKILYSIEAAYENKILQAWYMAAEPKFFHYLVGGAVLVLLLIVISIWDFRSRETLGLISVLLIMLNVVFLVMLIIIYSNPVFTTFVIVTTCVGVGIGASGI